METFKKYGKPALILVIGLVVCLGISILLHGFVMCIIEDPFSMESLTEVFEDQTDSVILDTLSDGDSALTLLKKADGTVFLLEFHKNLFLDRYQLLDVVHINTPAYDAPVQTVLRAYTASVTDYAAVAQAEPVSHSLQGGMFFQLYGLNTLLLLGLGALIHHFSLKKKKAKK